MEKEYVFKSTDESAMVEGCKFIGGLYLTKDPLRAESLRNSKLFGKTITEVTKEIEELRQESHETKTVKIIPKKPEPKPKPKVKSKK